MVARVPVHLAALTEEVHTPLPPQRATIKALPSHLHPARPYGSINFLTVSIASVESSWSPAHSLKHGGPGRASYFFGPNRCCNAIASDYYPLVPILFQFGRGQKKLPPELPVGTGTTKQE
jgi:hypothetical protein